jgi:hypothetical protein
MMTVLKSGDDDQHKSLSVAERGKEERSDGRG